MEKLGNPLVPLIALLTGVVLGAAGYALLTSGEPASTVATNPLGTGELEAPARRATALTQRPADVPPASANPLDVARQPIVTRASTPDEALGVIVFGTVRSESGEPLDQSSVNFTPKDPKMAPAGRSGLHVSTNKGGYAIHGLRPGKWKTLVRGRGYNDTAGEVKIEATATQRVDLVAKKAYIVAVKLRTPKGETLAEAVKAAQIPGLHRVEINAIATRAPLSELPMTDLRYHARFGLGKWSSRSFRRDPGMPDDPDVLGLIEMTEAPPAYISLVQRHHVLASRILEPGAKEIEFSVALAKILGNTSNVRIRVIDKRTRQPIVKAYAAISDRQSGGGGQPTGADGSILLKQQASGLMEISIRAKGYESYFVKLRLATGDVDLGTVELGPPIKTKIFVVNAAGAPQRASLSWSNLDRRTFPQPLISNRSATTDSKGFGELWGVGEGRFLVQARVRGKSLATRVIDTTKLGDEPIRMELVPTWPVAIDSTGMSEQRSLTLVVRDAEDRIVFARYLRAQYRFNVRLSSGRYTYRVFDGTEQKQVGKFEVSSAGGAELRVTG